MTESNSRAIHVVIPSRTGLAVEVVGLLVTHARDHHQLYGPHGAEPDGPADQDLLPDGQHAVQFPGKREFSLAFALGAVTTGFVVDKISVRWVYPFMVLGWSAAAVLTGFANGFWMLLTCRFALGLFEAGNWPCGIRTTRAVLRPEERSLGNSLFQSGTAFGAVITPMLILVLLRSADPGEPMRNAVMSVTGGTYAAVTDAPVDTWRYPFRVIGSLGVIWIVLWFATVPRLLRAGNSRADAGITRFRDVFRDQRFWVLFAAVVAINITWHGYRAWLPLISNPNAAIRKPR